MKKFYITVLFLLMISFALLEVCEADSGRIQYTAEQKKAITDIELITELREDVRNNEKFYKLNGSAPRLEIDKYEEFFNLIKDVEDNVLPAVNRKLDKWAKVYGDTSEEQKVTYKKLFAVIKGGNKTHVDWFTSYGSFAFNYADIKERISKVSKTRAACVEDLIFQANSSLSSIDAVLLDYRGPIYEKALKTLDIALMFDPKNKQAKELIKKIKKESSSIMEARDKQIDEGEWPGQFKNFAGPGSINKLSKSALEWFKNDTRSKGWAEANPQLVAVKGDWISAKKNILGETIQWGLPIYLAAHKQKDTDVVRVFSLTILTIAEKGVKRSPPFTGAWVGNNFDMRMGNLPGSSGSSKGPFILWRLLLAFSLIALGLVAASTKLSALNPKIKQFIDKLLPYKDMIGVYAAIFGILFFIKNLLFIAPFSDILPQLIAALTGIILGAKVFEEKTKNMKAPKQLSGAVVKVHDLFVKNKEKLDNLKAFELNLGYACLAAGVFHLLVGGITLF